MYLRTVRQGTTVVVDIAALLGGIPSQQPLVVPGSSSGHFKLLRCVFIRVLLAADPGAASRQLLSEAAVAISDNNHDTAASHLAALKRAANQHDDAELLLSHCPSCLCPCSTPRRALWFRAARWVKKGEKATRVTHGGDLSSDGAEDESGGRPD
jgi:hypothetical protein